MSTDNYKGLKEYVDEWLRYEEETGKFFWKKSANTGTRKEGRETGKTDGRTASLIKLQGKLYKSHQIAFLIKVGYIPDLVDHIDRNPKNNKWNNLRDTTQQVNCFNRSIDSRNVSGVTGVRREYNKYVVTFGKRVVARTKDFFEAVCIRKSQENAFNAG